LSEEAIGLSQEEANNRLSQYGLNQLGRPRQVSFLGIAREEISEPMILLLLAIGIIYSLPIFGKPEDALTIFVIIFVLVLVEIWNEYRAKKAISALSKIAAPKTRVYRNGTLVEVRTEEIVPGDILVFSQGTRVSADTKLLVSLSLQADESSLTGESLPIEKKEGDILFAETLVFSGEGEGEVFATGERTRFGKVSGLAQQIKPPKTPLQLAMKDLAKNLVFVALFFSVLIPILGVLRGMDLATMILTGLALAFATIPEEAPIIITMILGIGSFRLSQRNFLVKKIRAAETLGDATVILTDKTGTITESRMRVVSVFPRDQEERIIGTAVAALTEMSLSPTDEAILEKAVELKIETNRGTVLRERSFDKDRKTRTLLRKMDDILMLFMVGAPEEILKLAADRDVDIKRELEAETEKGRRVIAAGQRTIYYDQKDLPLDELERDLSFVALISLEDPPRKGIREVIERASRADVRTIMVTGDHPKTAAYIAKTVGISAQEVLTGEELDKLSDEELKAAVKEVSVYARTTPEHKYRLVKALHESGDIVAVTGDGVNDVLALKGADIGIAMGVKGTDAAKEVADAVLADDNFVTIGQALFEGRKFYDNLRKGFRYYLSAKTALIMIFLLPIAVGVNLPFAPIQIIVLELFMDLAASAGFVAEHAERTIYQSPPRDPRKKFLDLQMVRGIAISGVSLFAAVMISYFYAQSLNLSVVEAQTFAFTAWIIGHILLAFVSRSDIEPLYRIGLFSNRAMDGWAVAVFSFLALVFLVPAVAVQLKLTTLSLGQIGIVALISFFAVFWQEIAKVALYIRRRHRISLE
jgi:Ca2+-transporting ATPase